MYQYEQVEECLRRLGGFATLEQLYAGVDTSGWGTNTPEASIRRIVQVRSRFSRLRPGLWCLKAQAPELERHFGAVAKAEKKESPHTYYQGLLLELGNLRRHRTYVAPQDRSKTFLCRPLGELASERECPAFTYPAVVRKTRNMDVIWFSGKNCLFPDVCFEVEHSTPIEGKLLKFAALCEFNCRFAIVAPERRRGEFASAMENELFAGLSDRTRFLSYAQLDTCAADRFRGAETLSL